MPRLGYRRALDAPRTAPGPACGRPRAGRRSAGEQRVWVVGGAVRDLLLGGVPSDLDLVVEGDALAVARRAADAARRRGAGPRALRHGHGARPRRRRSTSPGRAARATRSPARCPSSSWARRSQDDLARRDFTVNALAAAARGRRAARRAGGARADLDARLLRVLHDASFRDDPTRLLRLARYAARLGFAVEPHTAALAAAAVAVGALRTVSGERLGAELRLLAREPQPAALRGARGARARRGAAAGLRRRRGAGRARAGALPDRRARPTWSRSAPRCRDARRRRAGRRGCASWRSRPRRPSAIVACAESGERSSELRGARPSAADELLRHRPVEAAVLRPRPGSEAARRWLERGATCARRSAATTCSPPASPARRSAAACAPRARRCSTARRRTATPSSRPRWPRQPKVPALLGKVPAPL